MRICSQINFIREPGKPESGSYSYPRTVFRRYMIKLAAARRVAEKIKNYLAKSAWRYESLPRARICPLFSDFLQQQMCIITSKML